MPRKIHDTTRADERRSLSDDPGVAGSPPSHTILVRLWKETRADASHEAIWRGTLTDMRGRQLGSFSTAAELAGILGQFAGVNVLLRFTAANVTNDS